MALVNFQVFVITATVIVPFVITQNQLEKVSGWGWGWEEEPACICYEIYEPICATDGKTYSNKCFLKCARRKNPNLFGACEGECPCCRPFYLNEPLDDDNDDSGWGWNVPNPQQSNNQETQTSSLRNNFGLLFPFSMRNNDEQVKEVQEVQEIQEQEEQTDNSEGEAEMLETAEEKQTGWPATTPTPSTSPLNCLCTLDYAPVCGSDNKTYGNACALACEQKKNSCLTQACQGECPCCPCRK